MKKQNKSAQPEQPEAVSTNPELPQDKLNKQIATWWWNMGKKKKDYTGTYRQYFENNGVKITPITHDWIEGAKGLRFEFALGSSRFNIEMFDADAVVSFDTVVKTFLTYLGDKAIFHNGYGREYKINWR